jgi:hypothetical protein
MMSCTYKISTLDKKSIVQEEIFTKTSGNESYEVRMEQTWRWGYVVVSEVEDTIDPDNPDGLMVTDYCIEDQDLSDGVSLWFTFSDNVPEEERKLFEEAWEEDGYAGIEDLGWTPWDMEMMFHGPLEVELLEQTEDSDEEEQQPSKGTWPF